MLFEDQGVSCTPELPEDVCGQFRSVQMSRFQTQKSEFAAFSKFKEKGEDLSRTLELIKVVLDNAKDKQWLNPPLNKVLAAAA
ncbi:hypothetical protein PIB30_001196 [Stylosanthes scabra]|uniref:Uncharacterized protein n=1 Tax=Stylosanthes scabra TaxID=79078 RepID=A0ABU6W0K5_9FABA|nr:hypothetical protein [Stylosanthes scabra]